MDIAEQELVFDKIPEESYKTIANIETDSIIVTQAQ